MANHLIFYFIFHGDVQRVKRFLDADRTLLTARTAAGLTPLSVAASRGQTKVAKLLLDAGADITGPGAGNEWTPLVWASYRGHVETVALLLERGADPTARGGNPIHYAFQRGHAEICRLLVEHGAVDDLAPSPRQKTIPLVRAVFAGNDAAAESILRAKPELARATTRDGRTLLHEAAVGKNARLVEVLLRAGADPAARDARNQTALDVARAHGQKASVRLLEAGVSAARPRARSAKPSASRGGRTR